jgi:peroxiredoxin
MKITILTSIIVSCVLLSCISESKTSSKKEPKLTFQNNGHELVYNMTQKVGDYSSLLKKKNVSYTYTYQTPDSKADVSNEKYIFNGELSYGSYTQHERTLPQLKGLMEQGFDGKEFWLKQNGEILTDSIALKRVAFNRPTNFYWFTMMQKLLDSGLNYEHLREEKIDNKTYDIVKITFQSKDDKPTDIYHLYINKKTVLVDQFLFTVADFGKMETPFLMTLEYEKIDGLLLPTKRRYKQSTWNADIDSMDWINVTWTNIKFNNKLSKEDFKKETNMQNNNRTSLKSKLEEKKENFELKADDTKKIAYKKGIESVENSGILSTAKQVGEKAPNFTLNNALGQPVELNDYLKKGNVVLTWYRGGWCPYCNLTLNELQQELPNFKANGATLIALTPELPDKSISTAEKNNLEFEVLSDLGNKIANEYGIVFKLTDDVAKMYNKAFDMNSYNGDTSNALPLAATYIINKNGDIIYAFLDADYRNRAEPSEITAFLKKLN